MDDQEQRELLYRIDERTEAIDAKVDVIGSRVSQNEDDINSLQKKTNRHGTILKGVTGGLGAILLWVADKITRII